MSQVTVTEAIQDAPRPPEINVADLKCGCCKKAMKPIAAGVEKARGAVFSRPCNCINEKRCYICSWCLDHCACGQRFMVD